MQIVTKSIKILIEKGTLIQICWKFEINVTNVYLHIDNIVPFWANVSMDLVNFDQNNLCRYVLLNFFPCW